MLYDDPPHRITIYSATTTRDAGGGIKVTFSSTAAQSAVPCLVNTASANTQLRYSQQAIVVTHTISFLSSALTVTLNNSMKFTDDNTAYTYLIKGIRFGQAVNGVPALTYVDVEQLLQV